MTRKDDDVTAPLTPHQRALLDRIAASDEGVRVPHDQIGTACDLEMRGLVKQAWFSPGIFIATPEGRDLAQGGEG